jgi:integrating conjugative element protein (TIGR03752 family)
VSGERITNAPAFLTQRVLAGAASAAARTAAAAQTTTTTGPLGGHESRVTGDVSRFVLGETLSEGTDEVGRWLSERQSQSFDAVFVRPGVRVALHIDRELPIDYDPAGRRLAYGRPGTEVKRALD